MAVSPIKVGVVGATGYTGVELLRLLSQHPAAQLQLVTSRAEAGTPVSQLFPSLRGHCDLSFVEPDMDALAEQCDAVFFATPHGVAMHSVPALMGRGVKIIDLSADFRIKDRAVWEAAYGEPHACPELLSTAVYGLPELFREPLAGAELVACAGCYPTAVQLGFAPLLERQLVANDSLIANAASGLSGAGRQAKIGMLLAESAENFQAYGVGTHRHTPEIAQGLTALSGQPTTLTFVPHLIPMIRGIHATLYAKPLETLAADEWHQVFVQRYADEPFVDVLPQGVCPQTRHVRGTNRCQLNVHYVENTQTLVVTSVEDNLTKGAAGQAVQIMNALFGLPEITGLNGAAVAP